MATAPADMRPPLYATSRVKASDPSEFSLWSQRGVPVVSAVTDDVWVIPVPAPGGPIRYTLCYAVRKGSSFVVIDPGWASEEGWDALMRGLEQIGAAPSMIRGIIGTHAHVDHIGLAHRLQLASGAWFAIGDGEPMPTSGGLQLQYANDDDRLLRTWGVPVELRDQLNLVLSSEAVAPPTPPVDMYLRDGESVDDVPLRVIATPGHTPGHICLATEDGSVLFTGDHVLPRISPHASVWVGGLEDPLRAYRSSLLLVQGYEDALICPGHEYRFTGIGLRINELDEDVQRRSDEILDLIEKNQPDSIWALAGLVTWSRGWDSLEGMTRRLALAECASHVEHLAGRGLPRAIATRPL